MTKDNIETRRHYARLYWNWPVALILEHLKDIDRRVSNMHPDELIDARKLLDEKMVNWK